MGKVFSFKMGGNMSDIQNTQPTRNSMNSGFLRSMLANPGILLACGIVIGIFFFIYPFGKTIIDLAMVLYLSVSMLILLKVTFTKRAADFSTFPQLVLLTTYSGLAINVSSTRNILTNPVTGSGYAVNMAGQSDMVQGICNLMHVNDNVVVGIIIFVILVIVQKIVISKGADRVGEVTARFTLDAMTTKMFAIQQQVSSGAITEDEGNKRIADLQQEIDFYAAMDGSTKFVSGNVTVGIFITIINLIGGIITGVMGGSQAGDAFKNYAFLTIGDGLMSQLPALMISFATGLLITKNNSREFLGNQIADQFKSDGKVYYLIGTVLLGLGLVFRNGATVVLFAEGALFLFLGYSMSKKEKSEEEQKIMKLEEEKQKQKDVKSATEDAAPLAKVDLLSMEIGFNLTPLVDSSKGAELLTRIRRIRREEALDLGIIVPKIHIQDQMSLSPDEYVFRIRGNEVGRAKLKIGHYMCLNTGSVPKDRELQGEATVDPTFGMKAIWLPESKRVEAENAGYAVVDPPTIIATHLTEIIRQHAAEIIDRESVNTIVENLKETNKIVVNEVLNGEHKYTYGEIEAVLKNLLAEQVSIINMVQIMETLADYAKYPRDVWFLTERVRESLGAQICAQYADENKELHVLNVNQSLAEKINANIQNQPGRKPMFALDPVDDRNFMSALDANLAAVKEHGYLPVILCPGAIRLVLRGAVERIISGCAVISIEEVLAAGKNVKIISLGEINV